MDGEHLVEPPPHLPATAPAAAPLCRPSFRLQGRLCETHPVDGASLANFLSHPPRPPCERCHATRSYGASDAGFQLVPLHPLRTELRRAQAVEASSEKPAEFVDLPGGVDSRTARKQELT